MLWLRSNSCGDTAMQLQNLPNPNPNPAIGLLMTQEGLNLLSTGVIGLAVSKRASKCISHVYCYKGFCHKSFLLQGKQNFLAETKVKEKISPDG